jgi:hypothetical protein
MSPNPVNLTCMMHHPQTESAIRHGAHGKNGIQATTVRKRGNVDKAVCINFKAPQQTKVIGKLSGEFPLWMML